MGQPIAYNSTGGVSGSIQAGKLSYAVETEGRDYTSYLSKKWVNSVEPVTGSYVFVTDSFTQGKTTEGNAYPLFYATPSTSSADVTAIASGLPGITASFSTANEALEAIAASGKYLILDAKEPYESIDADGLVLNLDASKLSSYPATGSNWYDLSGGILSGSLINGPVFNSKGYINFDGVDDYVELNNSLGNFGLSDFSIRVLFRTITTASPRTFIAKSIGGNPTLGYGWLVNKADADNLGFAVAEANASWGSSGTYSIKTDGIDINDGKWKDAFIVGDRSESDVSIYINGELQPLQEYVGDGGFNTVGAISNTRYLRVASESDDISPYRIDANIAKSQLYNKALTQAQVNQNYYGGNIVTDGLVFALDASKLVSYESGSTTAYSMTGSESGSLINGVGFDKENGGSWTFDGVDDNLVTNFRPSFSYDDGNDFTLEIWFYLESSSHSMTLTSMRNTGNGWVWAARSISGNIVFSWWMGNSWVDLNSSPTHYITPAQWNLGNLIYDSNTNKVKLYLNGYYVGELNAGTVFEDSSNITIPRWDNNMSGYSNPQTFSKYSVYNKALTAEEVTQNYNATKQRYVK